MRADVQLTAKPKTGDIREDGYRFNGREWRSPESSERQREYNRKRSRERYEKDPEYRRSVLEWSRKHRESAEYRKLQKAKERELYRPSSGSRGGAPGRGGNKAPGTLGAAAEMFVMFELLRVGIYAFRGGSPNGPHDLVFQLGNKLLSTQVKCGRVNVKTGRLRIGSRVGITSDLIAYVDIYQRAIRWVGHRCEVPQILQSRDNPSAIEKDRD